MTNREKQTIIEKVGNFEERMADSEEGICQEK